MTSIERTLELSAPPAAVWKVLADFASISAWAPNVDHSCLITEQAEEVGAIRRIQTGATTVLETVIAWEPEAVLSYAITGLPPVIRSVTNTWRLDPVGDATVATLTTAIDAGPRPPQKVVARVVGRMLGAASEQMLAGLAKYLDVQETSS